jgi:DNA replication ATP-dependent helicase Dna2
VAKILEQLSLDSIDLAWLRSSFSQEEPPEGFSNYVVNQHQPIRETLDLRDRLLQQTKSAVVGTTAQQIANFAQQGHTSILQPLFDFLVIDEGTQMDVAHAIVSFCALANNAAVIVAGDPKQLAPIQQSEPPLGLGAHTGSIYKYYLDYHQIPVTDLQTNYRSNEVIVAASRLAGYSSQLKRNSPQLRLKVQTELFPKRPTNWPEFLPWSLDLIRLLNPNEPIVTFVHSDETSGQQNLFEAQSIVSLCLLLREKLYDEPANWIDYGGQPRTPSDHLYTSEDFWKKGIGIVTVHRAQQSAIITLLELAFPETDPAILRAAVDTVERFQGQQRDIIFASYAVGDPDTIGQEEEFLLNLNRFNVTTSRARTKVVLFLTRSLVNHIAAEVEQIHQSAMIKEFVDLYCDQKSVCQLHWINDENQPVGVPGVLHAKAFAANL